MEEKRAFWEMHKAACQMLAGKAPEEIAEKAGVSFENNAFCVPSLGKCYRFSYPEYVCEDKLHDWQYLTILHYLNLADGTPVSGTAIPMAQMPSGMVRGGGYDRTTAEYLSRFLRGKSEAQVRAIFASLGGEEIGGKADLNIRLPYLPRFPLYVNVWFADEEFPPSGRLLVDSTAGHYLTIEDAVSVAEVILELLK